MVTTRLSKKTSKSTNQVQAKSSKKRKASDKGSVESCLQCLQNVDDLVECKRCMSKTLCVGCITKAKWYPNVSEDNSVKACHICCNFDKKPVKDFSGFIASNDFQDQFANTPKILNVATRDDMNHTNGWICDSDSDQNPQDASNVFPTSSPSVDHHHAATATSEESVGLWHGNAVGQQAKEILQAIEHHYPNTFQGVQIRSKPHWLSILEGFHVFIKGFLDTSGDALEEDQITSLEADLNDFERLGFDLSWARNRLDMVKNLKFGNEGLELVALEAEVVEANARLDESRLEYDRAADARNRKVDEVAHKFGDVCERAKWKSWLRYAAMVLAHEENVNSDGFIIIYMH